MIHRTRDGEVPSGGAEPGRSIVQMGTLFVEYSGTVPTQAELDAHLRPPPPTNAQRIDSEVANNVAFDALIIVLAGDKAKTKAAFIADLKAAKP